MPKSNMPRPPPPPRLLQTEIFSACQVGQLSHTLHAARPRLVGHRGDRVSTFQWAS